MRCLLPLTALLLPACAMLREAAVPMDTPLMVRSHNVSDVDVYILCGEHDARWLGVIPQRSGAAFSISPAQRRCVSGLNFFLVVRNMGRGYWVGPIRPRATSAVQLVIEKYAALSSAYVSAGR